MKYLFIGIGGSGMSSLASYLIAGGHEVFGYDAKESNITKYLQESGAKMYYGSEIEIPADTFLCIYSLAISDTNPLLIQAKTLGIECLTYPQALAMTIKDKATIAIAGTHGKTTTTAMTALALRAVQLNPSLVFGGSFQDTHELAWYGNGKIFVIEACEFKKSFLNYRPMVAVITNIDDDHLDYYGSLENIQKAFAEFVLQIKDGGALICDVDDEKLSPVIQKCTATIIDFKKYIPHLSGLSLAGEHNKRNGACASAVADFLNSDLVLAREGISSFTGTARRSEFLGTNDNGALIISDYAHHPTEVRATLNGLRERYPDKKIIAIFQPHLYTRFNTLFDRFAQELSKFDEVYVLPVYAARDSKPPENCRTIEELVSLISSLHTQAYLYSHIDASKDSVMAFIGAGSIDEVAKTYVDKT